MKLSLTQMLLLLALTGLFTISSQAESPDEVVGQVTRDSSKLKDVREGAGDAASTSWKVGPFERPAGINPVLQARFRAPFDCPLEKQTVDWDGAYVTDPAATVRDGQVVLFYEGMQWQFTKRTKPQTPTNSPTPKKSPEPSEEMVRLLRIGFARSRDGFVFQPEAAPVVFPSDDEQKAAEREIGCRSPRIVEDETGAGVMLYLSGPEPGVLAVATSSDWIHWKKHGPAFQDARSSAGGAIVCSRAGDRLVATKISGQYWMYWSDGSVKLAMSPDLIHWKPVEDAAPLCARAGHFDARRIIPGPPAVLMPEGILLLYNGEDEQNNPAEGNWAVGEALFDATNPARLLQRTESPVFKPEFPYETTVDGRDIKRAFATGLVLFQDRWLLYYGAGRRAGVAVWDPSGKPVNPPVPRKPKLPEAAETVAFDVAGRAVLRSGWELAEAPSVQADGVTLSKPGFDSHDWFDATVPGTVLATLVDQGVVPDPLYGQNNLRISEKYARQDYWYRKAFTVPASQKGRRLTLQFNGINYAAEVWLNGTKLGTIKGAFIRGRFDVTDVIQLDAPNWLAVKLSPQPHTGTPHEQSLGNGAGPNGGATMEDGPSFGCSIGWDWIPGIRDRCSGLWQDVELQSTGPVQIGDPQVITAVPRLDRAEVSIFIPLENRTKMAQKGKLRCKLGDIVLEQPATIGSGETASVEWKASSTPELNIERPRLWWPNGTGKPELYPMELTFVSEDGAVSDMRRLDIGLRELSTEYTSDSGMEMILKVNGQRIFCRGGNLGMDDALKRLEPERMEAWVRMHRDANLNIVRNWVAQSTSEEFYRLCDRYGILVWNDFAMANPYDGPDPHDKGLFIENARDTVLRFRNHPCIALWCARNESVPLPIFADELYRAVWKLDRTRPFIPDSAAFGVSGHGPYRNMDAGFYYAHAAGMKSELGLNCVPTADAMRAALDPGDRWPINDAWAYHDFCRKGAMAVDGYVNTIEIRYGKARDLDDFCRKAQWVNYDSHRAACEAWGRAMWRGASGLLFWMTHCSWPSTVWQLYSYDLEPTGALFGARKACEPVHIQADPRDDTVTVVNRTLAPLSNVVASASVYDLSGRTLSTDSRTVSIEANSVLDCLHLPAATDAPVRLVVLLLKHGDGTILSRNFYILANKESEMQAITKLEPVALTAVAREGELHLANNTSHPALMVKVTLRTAKGERILPVYYGDNYFSLMPGETRDITIETSRHERLNGAVVEIEGCNVPLLQATNTRAHHLDVR